MFIYHSTATEFAQASTEDVENMTQNAQLLSKGTIQQLNHTVEDIVSSLPEASVLAHAATFPGAFALLLDPRTKN